MADRETKQVKGEVLEVSNGSCRSFSFPFSRTLLQSQSGWAAMRKMEKLCTRRTEMDSCTDGKKNTTNDSEAARPGRVRVNCK